MSTLEHAKDRIRKLLALAADGSEAEGEIRNALNYARSLMQAHHLTEDDVRDDPHADAAVHEMKQSQVSGQFGRMAVWESGLASFVQDLTGVSFYTEPAKAVRVGGRLQFGVNGKPLKRPSVLFYGIDEEVDLATHVYSELSLTIAASARLKYGGVARGDGRQYAEGFVVGLIQKLRDSKRGDDEQTRALTVRCTAIVERKQQEARQWLSKERGVRLKTTTVRPVGGSEAAFDDGLEDGRKQEVSGAKRKKIG